MIFMLLTALHCILFLWFQLCAHHKNWWWQTWIQNLLWSLSYFIAELNTKTIATNLFTSANVLNF